MRRLLTILIIRASMATFAQVQVSSFNTPLLPPPPSMAFRSCPLPLAKVEIADGSRTLPNRINPF